MKATQLAEGVYWVGAIDWNLRDYHGYTLPGTTYNAYLVVGKNKTALIDNTYPGHEYQMMERIKDIIDPKKIDIIVMNHVEKDHSGALPGLAKLLPGVPIYCTEAAVHGFKKHYDTEGWNFKPVKSLDKIDLGGKTLVFVEAPLLHWPDSMFTYLAEDKILFPNDAFGQHIAGCERFDDELGKEASLEHAKKFFANLIVPLAPKVLKKLDEVTKLGIPIAMVAPSHGVIWRTYVGDMLGAYVNWCKGISKNKVTIVYDTMHHSTDMMAQTLAEGIMAEGVAVKVCILRDGKFEGNHRSNIVTEILDSKAVLIGSPTLQDEVYPTVADFLSYLHGVRPGRLAAKKIGFAFGSHGGQGGAIRIITEGLRKAGIEPVNEGYELLYKPDAAEMKKCYELGQDIARRVKAM
jgi:flavorubredoxin